MRARTFGGCGTAPRGYSPTVTSNVERVEDVAAADIRRGDVVTDALGWRWLTVHQIRTVGSMICLYGTGPHDRMMLEATERVGRRATA